jgi:hypothetical protein
MNLQIDDRRSPNRFGHVTIVGSIQRLIDESIDGHISRSSIIDAA